MRLIASRLSEVRLAAEDGFTMLMALATLVVVMGLSAAAFAAINADLPLTSNDSFQKDAYAAAQAGIQRYQYALDQNSEFWTQCAPASSTWINQAGALPLKSTTVPGSTTEKYAVELLPAAGQATYTQCSTANPVASMIQATGIGAGSIRIRVTGYAGNVKRTIVANLREQSFLDYEYFTNFETSDPYLQVAEAFQGNSADTTIEPPDLCGSNPGSCGSNYSAALSGAQAQCAQYRYAGRYTTPFYADSYTDSSGHTHTGSYSCDQIQFAPGDKINGPFHSNDQVLVCPNGTGPVFGRTSADSIEFGNSTGWVNAGGCSGNPVIKGTIPSTISILKPPPSNASLKTITAAPYLYTGTTCIKLQVGSILVAQPGVGANASKPSCFSSGLTWSSTSYPTNGVLYVANGACSLTYDVESPSYTGNTGCGTVYVAGVDDTPLTIAAENDIVIDGNLTYNNSSSSMLGLIANNFIRVYHPVGTQPLTNNASVCTQSSSNATGSLSNLEIDAMLLSLQHSFVVDQYNCGASLSNLTVNGGIAQMFRGPVGTSGGTGYIKDYTYDDRLRYEEPPHFIDPVQGSWRIQRQTECDTTAC